MVRLTEEERQELARKKLNGTITAQENALLESWYEQHPPTQVNWSPRDANRQTLHARLFKVIREKAGIETGVIRPLRTHWLRYAAAVMVVCGMGVYLYLHPRHEERPSVAVQTFTPLQKDVLPAKGGAVLTLADGTQVLLDSLGSGQVMAQNGVKVFLNDNQLSYSSTHHGASETYNYNTLSTRNGGQITLGLPDGSRVWLNAASSIKYPVTFAGNERRVEINGEAYFEIARQEGRPFLVNVNDHAEVRVLGTHFNVKSYDDENTTDVTLLEGAVKIAKPDEAAEMATVIKPGQQAQFGTGAAAADRIKVIDGADLDAVMAWKNGMFSFNKADIRTIMHEVARWYNVDVIYTEDIKERFHVEINRDIPVSDLLNILAGTGKVHFRIEGRQITVMP